MQDLSIKQYMEKDNDKTVDLSNLFAGSIPVWISH